MLIPIAMQGKKHLVGSKKVKNIIRIDQDPRSIELYKQTGAEDVLRKKIWKVESDIALFFKMAGNFSKTCGYQCQRKKIIIIRDFGSLQKHFRCVSADRNSRKIEE